MNLKAKDFLIYHICAKKMFKEVLKPEKTAINTFEVLLTIKENPSLNVGQIGHIINISRPNTTPLVDKLVSDGYVKKEISQTDLRSFTLKITEEGEKELNRIFSLLDERLDDYFDKFSPEEQTIVKNTVKDTNKLLYVK